MIRLEHARMKKIIKYFIIVFTPIKSTFNETFVIFISVGNQHFKMLDFTAIKPRKPLQSFPRDKTFQPKLGKNFTEYLMNTTLHGLKYIGDVSLSFFER